MTFLNSALLFGLFALLIPPIVHLLNRRRYEVVDWAAMQFLHISKKTRRKVMFEQLTLMLLRMGLIAVLVLALAAPVLDLGCVAKLPAGQRLARLAGQTNRDIVVIIDGSYSMDCKWQNSTAHDEAREWTTKFFDDLPPGDRMAILQARQQPVLVAGALSGDSDELAPKLAAMPRPRGGVDWPRTVQEAFHILQTGTNPQKEIVILTDGQRYGWADAKSLERWELLTQSLSPETLMPRLWVVNVVPGRPSDPPNWMIAPITANRAVASLGREVKFKFELQVPHEEMLEDEVVAPAKEPPPPPEKVRFEVDGQPAGEKTPSNVREPRLGMDFTRKFGTAGSHLVSVFLSDDALPGDNRRDFALEVLPAIPVLLVDGDSRSLARSRSSDFLRLALAPANDAQPAFLLRTVSIHEFTSQILTNPIAREANSLPRVLILTNVAELTEDQQKSIEEFVKRGGGVLVALGPRCSAHSYNERAFRDGQGWLPARLVEPKGDENVIDKAPVIDTQGLSHPALELFKDNEKGGFQTAYFPRYWKLDTEPPGSGTAFASLTNRDPLFVEKNFDKKGRVILSAVPFDNSWRTNLTDLYDFVPLAHEIVYYLAAAHAGEANLSPHEHIVFRPGDGEPPGGVTIEPPEGSRRRIEVASWPLDYEDTREAGVYKLTTDSGKVQYYVVQPDMNESILTPWTDNERREVQARFPKDRFAYAADRGQLLESIRQSQDNPQLWWVFLLLLIGLLVAELAFTRHLVRKNPPVTD